MKKTDKDKEFFRKEGKKLLRANDELTPGEVRNILESKYGQMYWKKDGTVPKKGETGFVHKFGASGKVKTGPNTGKKQVFKIETLAAKAAKNLRQGRKRGGSIKQQTVGKDDFPKVSKSSGLEVHHKRGVALYDPIFEGLNKTEADDLAKWFVDVDQPLGNKLGNADILPVGPHRHIHRYMEKEGYVDTKVPSFKDMSLSERKTWALDNFSNWSKDTDRKTLEIMQEFRQKYPTQYRDLYIDEITENSKVFSPKINRAKLIKLGIAGVVLPAAGSVANTLEASERAKIAAETNNRLDVFQSWLSNAELTTGLIPAGEIISTPLGVANLGIDAARYGTQPTDTSSRQRYRHGER